MLSFPNAKINIGLYITEKRPDGFHNLESCFYPVGLVDVLEIMPAKKLSFKSTGIEIPGNPETNLCLKAYRLVNQDFKLPPVMIHLHKIVPIGAGLGGGSADCAFFIQNKPKFCFGKGDEFEDIEVNLSNKFIVLVNPNIHISTAEAYSGIKPQKANVDLKKILQSPVNQWVGVIKNDFENHLLPKYPAIENIKNSLYTHGAEYASMTGSGSTVFGIFNQEIDLKEVFPKCTTAIFTV
jgi:4-diphosphocytidyl-2-C-methyl-D-erythritol kinase